MDPVDRHVGETVDSFAAARPRTIPNRVVRSTRIAHAVIMARPAIRPTFHPPGAPAVHLVGSVVDGNHAEDPAAGARSEQPAALPGRAQHEAFRGKLAGKVA